MTPWGSGTWLTPKITFIASGSAIENPMNEPKVTMYSAVSDQVCLFLKMANCLAMLSFIVPKAVRRITSSAATTSSGIATHMLMMPRPVGLGRYRYRPRIEGMKASVYSQVILANATIGLPVAGETVFRLFMPNQHSTASGTSDSTHAKPAFWIHVGVPALMLPKIQPLSFISVIGSP